MLMSCVAEHPSSKQEFHESMYVGVFFEKRPVEPVGLIVVAVEVVVPALRSTHLVSHENHGQADGEQRDRVEVLDLPVPESLDNRVIGRALRAAVPAPVVARAVAVLLPV